MTGTNPPAKSDHSRTSLETITRDDASRFIEHEQDRGMQPKTVSTRLRLFCAFLRYLVDREVVHPDMLKRKLRVKVPEALPRATRVSEVNLREKQILIMEAQKTRVGRVA